MVWAPSEWTLPGDRASPSKTSPLPSSLMMTSFPPWLSCIVFTRPEAITNTQRTGSSSRKMVWRRPNSRCRTVEAISACCSRERPRNSGACETQPLALTRGTIRRFGPSSDVHTLLRDRADGQYRVSIFPAAGERAAEGVGKETACMRGLGVASAVRRLAGFVRVIGALESVTLLSFVLAAQILLRQGHA
jgi:hypothetical protein